MNIVIITNGNYFANVILEKLLDQYSESISGILIISGDYKGRIGFRSLWELSKVTALPYILYKVISLFFFKAAQFINQKKVFDVKRLAKQKNIPTKEHVSIKSEEPISWIQACHPDLIVSVSCPQLIGKEILSAAKLGGINIHSSLLPSYAGLAPYFWVLSQGERETGITVHYMTLKFDEGNILVQKKVNIETKESAFHLFNLRG